MRRYLFRGAGLFLFFAHGFVAASTVDVPIACSGAIDDDVSAAIGQLSGSVTRVVVSLSGGSCSIAQQHTIDGNVSFAMVGSGIAATTLDTSVAKPFYIGGTTGGVDFSVSALTIQKSSDGVIDINSSTLTIDQTRFINASSSSNPYISTTNAFATIKRSSFEQGNSLDGGGAITATADNGATLSISDTTFSNNITAGNGGAISADEAVTLDRVLFENNHADIGLGGALYTTSQPLTIRNSTFTGNGAFEGGAINVVSVSSGSYALNNVTLYGDSAPSGSELYLAGDLPVVLSINNSLVGGECEGFAFSPGAHGSIESPGNTCRFSKTGNQFDVDDADLHLGVLGNNGGLTGTMYPAAGSVMINKGSTDCEHIDQRSLVRNVGACDVGAVEVGATLTDELFGDGFGG